MYTALLVRHGASSFYTMYIIHLKILEFVFIKKIVYGLRNYVQHFKVLLLLWLTCWPVSPLKIVFHRLGRVSSISLHTQILVLQIWGHYIELKTQYFKGDVVGSYINLSLWFTAFKHFMATFFAFNKVMTIGITSTPISGIRTFCDSFCF